MSHRNRQRRNNNTGNRQEHISQDRWFDDGGRNDTDYSYQGRSDRNRSKGGNGGYGSRSSYTGSQGGSGYGRSESEQFEGGWGSGDSGRGYGEAGYPGEREFSSRGRYSEQSTYGQGPSQRGYDNYSSGYGESGYGGQGNYSGSYGQSTFGQRGYSSQQHGFQQSEGYCPECGHSHQGSMSGRGYQSQGQMSGPSYRPQSGWGQSGNFSGQYRQGGISGQGSDDFPADYNEGGFPQSSRTGSSWRRHSQSDEFSGGYGGNYGNSGGNWGSSQQTWGNRPDSSLSRTGGNVSSDWWSYEGQRSNRHTNKGPKGYKRSDERIKEDVNDRLSDGSIDASEINVTVQNGEVTLTGTVESRRVKFHAETIAEQVLGVTDVNNQLRVTNQMSGSESSRSKTSDFEEKSSQSKSTSKTSSTPMTSGAR